MRRVPPTTDDRGELWRWAKAQGLGSVLELELPLFIEDGCFAPGIERLLVRIYRAGGRTVEDLISGQDPRIEDEFARARRSMLRPILAELREHFEAAAWQPELAVAAPPEPRLAVAAAPAEAKLIEGWSRPLADPALQPFADRALAAWQALRARINPWPPERFQSSRMGLIEEPLRALFEAEGPPVAGGWFMTRPSYRVEIPLGRWRQEPLAPSCGCEARTAGCPHALAALATLQERLHAPPGPAREQLYLALTTPDWQRLLRALDQGLLGVGPAAEAAPARLVTWRVSERDGILVGLWPMLHKPLKRGGWSSGTRASFDVLREHPEWLTLAELRALDPIEQARMFREWGHSESFERRQLDGLELLVANDRVLLDGAPALPVTVARATPELSIHRDGEGFSAEARVNGRPLPAELARRLARSRRIGWVDRERRECLVIESTVELARIAGALARFPASLPPEGVEALLGRLAPLGERVALELPEELEGELLPPNAEPFVRLSPRAGGALDAELRVRPLAQGPSFPPGEGPKRILGLCDGRRVTTVRALDPEIARARELLETLPLEAATEAVPWRFELPAGDAALALVASLQAEAAGRSVVVEWGEGAPKLRIVGRAVLSDLRVKVEDKRDWFGLSGRVEVDGERVQLALLLDAARKERRFVPVGEGRWIEISDELRRRLARSAAVVFEGRSGLEVGRAAAEALSDLTDGVAEVELCARWRDGVSKLARAKRLEPKLPKGLKASLRPYQVEGYRWLRRLAEWGVGACLADDMGLGKTVQALAVLLDRAKAGPALVVAPTSVGFNWVREAKRFAPSLNVVLYRETERSRPPSLGPGDLLVASYGLVVRDAAALAQLHFATLVLDEAQAIKNPATHRARAVRDLQADWRLALTGTPIENHLGELWSLFRCACPGLLGSWEQFRERFALPIERDRDPKARAALAEVIRPFVLRRTKAEVAPELPTRTEVVVRVGLSPGERRLYDDARLTAVARLTEERDERTDRRFEMLAELTRLRQLACHPRLYDPLSRIPSSKLERLLGLVSDLREGGHRALVFSQFVGHLSLVREALDAASVSYQYLDGQTPPAAREARVDAFQRGEGELFLISLKAGGLGLNLTAADYVLHLDPWWNPAVEDQATDRAHRIGQTRPVTVYRLIAEGTVEEAIVAMHEEKRDLVAAVLGGSDRAGKLSTDELLALIRAA